MLYVFFGHSWYGNNCICRDHCDSDACYQEDVNALIEYGFDSVKLDGCGAQVIDFVVSL